MSSHSRQRLPIHGRNHLQGGDDPIPGWSNAPSGDTIDAIIQGLDPAGWWKLNESSGSVAADSSGNGLDLSVDASGLAPTWAQPAGPPGEQTADFETGTGGLGGTAGRVARSWASIATDFTAGIFVSRNSTSGTYVMGQGNPDRAGGTGWMLAVHAFNAAPFNTPYAHAAGLSTVNADNALAASTWAMVAVVLNGTTWTLNVNGLNQSVPRTGSFTPVAGSSPLWIGQDGGLGGNSVSTPKFVGSYAFLIPEALTGAQLLEIYNSAILPGGANDGKALLSTGLGATYWDFPIEVTY